MAKRGIQLRRYKIKQANHYHLRGFRIRVEVADTCGDINPNVFVMHRSPADPVTGETVDTFQAVASFPDMSEYPVGEPDPDRPFAFFRSQSIELDVRSVDEYDTVWNTLVNEVGHLINALDKADELVVDETTWVGCEPADSESASASSSASASA